MILSDAELNQCAVFLKEYSSEMLGLVYSCPITKKNAETKVLHTLGLLMSIRYRKSLEAYEFSGDLLKPVIDDIYAHALYWLRAQAKEFNTPYMEYICKILAVAAEMYDEPEESGEEEDTQ